MKGMRHLAMMAAAMMGEVGNSGEHSDVTMKLENPIRKYRYPGMGSPMYFPTRSQKAKRKRRLAHQKRMK